MFCTSCGNEAEKSAKFCSNCGIQLNVDQSVKGDGSINIAGSNVIDNSNLHVGDIYGAQRPEDIAYIDRTYIKRVEVAGNQIKSFWVTFSGVIGFIGSIASIFSLWATNWQFTGLLAVAFSFYVILAGRTLSRLRFIKLPFTQFNLEADKVGLIYLTKIGGDCPKCDGKLKLVNIKVSENHYKTMLQCTRSKSHLWDFDPTVLK